MGLHCAGRLVWWHCSSIRAREFLTSILGRTLLAPTLRFAVGQLGASSPLRASSWHANFCTTRQQTYNQSAHTCFRCPCRLVVRTSRRGRDNPGSNPGKDTVQHRAKLGIASEAWTFVRGHAFVAVEVRAEHLNDCQFARVVKGVDLRSTEGNFAWAQTPQLTTRQPSQYNYQPAGCGGGGEEGWTGLRCGTFRV